MRLIMIKKYISTDSPGTKIMSKIFMCLLEKKNTNNRIFNEDKINVIQLCGDSRMFEEAHDVTGSPACSSFQ